MKDNYLLIKESDVFSWLKDINSEYKSHLEYFKGDWKCIDEVGVYKSSNAMGWDILYNEFQWIRNKHKPISKIELSDLCEYLINNDKDYLQKYISEIRATCGEILSLLRYDGDFMDMGNYYDYYYFTRNLKEKFDNVSEYFSIKHPESKNVNNKKFDIGLLTNKAIDKIVEYINKSDIVEINSTDLFQMVIEADFTKLYVPKYKTKTQWLIRHLKQKYYDLDWYKAACKSIGKTINDVDKTNVGDPDWVDYFPK